MKRPRLSFATSLIQHRELWWRLTDREIRGRYRGSVLGWSWSLITPLLMLMVYTFVFSSVFKARWGGLEQAGPLGFAINLFAGLIVFNIFAECANQAPNLILGSANYVTKVIFPLEVLGGVSVATALFHGLTSSLVLLCFELLANHTLPISLLWLPVVWLPLALGCLAMSWVLSALGVFLRDLSQVMGVAVSMLMFLSAVFYPLSSLPPRWQPLLGLNPLVRVIEETRRVMVQGQAPSMVYVVGGSLLTLLLAEISYRQFNRARRGFADVL